MKFEKKPLKLLHEDTLFYFVLLYFYMTNIMFLTLYCPPKLTTVMTKSNDYMTGLCYQKPDAVLKAVSSPKNTRCYYLFLLFTFMTFCADCSLAVVVRKDFDVDYVSSTNCSFCSVQPFVSQQLRVKYLPVIGCYCRSAWVAAQVCFTRLKAVIVDTLYCHYYRSPGCK